MTGFVDSKGRLPTSPGPHDTIGHRYFKTPWTKRIRTPTLTVWDILAKTANNLLMPLFLSLLLIGQTGF